MPKIYISHLVQDEDHDKRFCDGEEYVSLPSSMPYGSVIKLCDKCNAKFRLRMRNESYVHTSDDRTTD